MRRRQRSGELASDPQRLRSGQLTEARDAIREALALEQLHDDVRGAIDVVAEVEDLHDAGIADRRRRLRFAEEPLHDLRLRRQQRQQRLDGCTAAEQDVLADVDGPHASRADLLDQPVLTDVGSDDVFTSFSGHNRLTRARTHSVL